MDKKEYLKKILVQLEPIRDLAKWLEVLVDEWNLWEITKMIGCIAENETDGRRK